MYYLKNSQHSDMNNTFYYMNNTFYYMNKAFLYNIIVQQSISITTKECVHITNFICHKLFDINTCVSL